MSVMALDNNGRLPPAKSNKESYTPIFNPGTQRRVADATIHKRSTLSELTDEPVPSLLDQSVRVSHSDPDKNAIAETDNIGSSFNMPHHHSYSSADRTPSKKGQITQSMRALRMRGVDILLPRPKLYFEYGPVDDSVTPLDVASLTENGRLQLSDIQSMQINDLADDMDSHALRTALERDSRRSISELRRQTCEIGDAQPDEASRYDHDDRDKIMPWPWRDSQDFSDRARSPQSLHSRTSQIYHGLQQDPDIGLYSDIQDPEGSPQPELPKSPSDSEHSLWDDYGHVSGPPVSGPKYDYKANSGRVLTSAWTTYLKRATAERIRRGQEACSDFYDNKPQNRTGQEEYIDSRRDYAESSYHEYNESSENNESSDDVYARPVLRGSYHQNHNANAQFTESRY